MKRILLSLALVGALTLALVACAKVAQSKQTDGTTDENKPADTTDAPYTTLPPDSPVGGSYLTIPQDRAKAEMDTLAAEGQPFILLDVRRADEYAEGHIEGAILLPNEEIGSERPEILPDLDTPLYVYCRSGRRSLEAAKKLAAMGYTVFDFGGIIDWQYGTVTE